MSGKKPITVFCICFIQNMRLWPNYFCTEQCAAQQLTVGSRPAAQSGAAGALSVALALS